MLSLGLSVPELMGRWGGGGNDDVDIVHESITVTNGASDIDITEIDGIAIKGNIPIVVWAMENVALNAVQPVNVLLRKASDETWVTTNYTDRTWGGTTNSAYAATNTHFETSNNGWNGGLLCNITTESPTLYFGYAPTTRNLIRGCHRSADAHDGIRFEAQSTTFASGTIHIYGFRINSNRINVTTHTWTGETGEDWEVPSGHTFGNMVGLGIDQSAQATMKLRFGVDGTMDSGASDYQVGVMSGSAGAVSYSGPEDDIHLGRAGAAAGDEFAWFWGTNCGAYPVATGAHNENTGAVQEGWGIDEAGTNRNYIGRRVTGGGTIDGGTTYITSYRIGVTVTDQSMGDGTATEVEVTDTSPLMAYQSLAFNPASQNILIQYGDSGGYNTGNYEYVQHSRDTNHTSETLAGLLVGENVFNETTWVSGLLFGLNLKANDDFIPFNPFSLSATNTNNADDPRVGSAMEDVGATAAEYDRFKWIRGGGGAFASGITVKQIKFNVKIQN